jgi:hypothetical protein
VALCFALLECSLFAKVTGAPKTQTAAIAFFDANNETSTR